VIANYGFSRFDMSLLEKRLDYVEAKRNSPAIQDVSTWRCETCGQRYVSLEEGRNAHFEDGHWWHLGCADARWNDDKQEFELIPDAPRTGKMIAQEGE
jgi:hypothetical protein